MASPLEALCTELSNRIGPWCGATPEAHAELKQRHAEALAAPVQVSGAEAMHLASITAHALGLRYVHQQRRSNSEKQAALTRLFEAMEAADSALHA